MVAIIALFRPGPMENIPVPTPGVWNINDIYTPKPNVIDGRVIPGGGR